MLNICFNTGFVLSLNFNCNKCHCLCLGGYHKFSFAPMNLGLNKIDWCAQVTYLGVVINTGKSISFDITQTKRHFFIACNSIFSSASKTNELLHLSLQEMYSLPILLYAAPAVTFSSRQLRTLNSCWNLIYRRIFGFNIWESVKLFICGLGRLDLCHLLWVRRTKFYRHLLTVKSDSLRTLYRNFCTYFYNVDVCLKLVQLSNCRAQDYIRADYQRSASFGDCQLVDYFRYCGGGIDAKIEA
jgi:hypothetical protein